MPPARTIPIIVYDFPAISRFFRSVALAMAIQRTTGIHWETYRDSKVLNTIYTVMFWKEPPGFAEVHTGAKSDIDRITDELHVHFLTVWLKKVYEGGPREGNAYVVAMEQVRAYARDAVQSMFADASSINNEVIGVTGEAIRDLARIKLAAQVGVAVIGAVAGVAFVAAAAGGAAGGASLTILGLEAGAGGTVFGGVGAAHSITHSIIKSWEGGAGAQVAGIAWEGGKAGVSEAGGHVAGNALEKALAGSARSEQLIKSFEGEIRKYSERLAQTGLRKKAQQKAANIVADRTARVGVQQAAQQGFGRQAVNAARVGKTIPVVFAAWDIIDAFGDYNETVGRL